MSPVYVNSKGEQIDTSTLAEPHLQRAYDKAVREGNDENITALTQELQARGESIGNDIAEVQDEDPSTDDTEQ